jgi:hypothetical protein
MLHIHTKNYIRLKIFFNPEYFRAISKISLTRIIGKLVKDIFWLHLSSGKLLTAPMCPRLVGTRMHDTQRNR